MHDNGTLDFLPSVYSWYNHEPCPLLSHGGLLATAMVHKKTYSFEINKEVYMKLWVDDVREAPQGYTWCQTVNQAKQQIEYYETLDSALAQYIGTIDLIDIDHDAGDFAQDGGDYIKLLDWLEETGRSYPIHIHSMTPVGIENMRRIIRRNGWTEV